MRLAGRLHLFMATAVKGNSVDKRESRKQQEQAAAASSSSWNYSYSYSYRSFTWPPRSYSCSFCKREFRSAQALGGHMNVHRRDRARLRHADAGSPPPPPPPAMMTMIPNLNHLPPPHQYHHRKKLKLELGVGVVSSNCNTYERNDEAPNSAPLGAMGSLLRRLDMLPCTYDGGRRISKLKDNIRSISDKLKKLSEVQDPPLTVNYWMKHARELSYDIEAYLDMDELDGQKTEDSLNDSDAKKEDNHVDSDAMLEDFIVDSDDEKEYSVDDLHAMMTDYIDESDDETKDSVVDDSDGSTQDSISSSDYKISGFMTRAKGVTDRYEKFSLDSVLSCPTAATTIESPRPSRDVGLVGMESHIAKLISLLQLKNGNDNDNQLKVVSILGDEGIGKSTLMQKIWNESFKEKKIWPEPQSEVNIMRAFIRMGKKPDVRMILRSILSQFSMQEQAKDSGVTNLIHDIRKHLEQKRYIIIVDDVWSESIWDVVSRAFPDCSVGSRIITTTSDKEVALACCNYVLQHSYIMKPLTVGDSEQLFIRTVVGSRTLSLQLSNDVSVEIKRKCGGLPLAVTWTAILVASQPEIKEKLWQLETDHGVSKMEKEENLNSEVKKFLAKNLRTESTPVKILTQVLRLCYYNLPDYLKTCLLYLSVYPENYYFLKEDLVKLWVAEGFICTSEEDKVEAAGRYFDVLVSLGLIQRMDVNCNNQQGEVVEDKEEEFVVHPTVFDFITCKSVEDNFITLVDYSQSTVAPKDKIHRLSFHFGSATYATTPEGLSQVRTLSFMGLSGCMPSLAEFKIVRVIILDLWSDDEEAVFSLTAICNLPLLKYLKISCNIAVELPEKIGCLKHLETLEINSRVNPVPSDIFYLSGPHIRLQGTTYSTPGSVASVNNVGAEEYDRSAASFNVESVPQDVEHSSCAIPTKITEVDLDRPSLMEPVNQKAKVPAISGTGGYYTTQQPVNIDKMLVEDTHERPDRGRTDIVVGALSGMLDALAGKLGDELLAQEYALLSGVRGDVVFLQAELSSMRAAIQDCESLDHHDHDSETTRWVGLVREVAYDIEDWVDLFGVRVDGGAQPASGFRAWIRRGVDKLMALPARHTIANELRDLKERVIKISEQRNRYRLHTIFRFRASHPPDPRLASLFVDPGSLVGLDGKVEDVSKTVLDAGSGNELRIVSIVGMAGSGKTTLANAVYRRLQADNNFQCSAFVSIGPKPDMVEAVKDLLSKLGEGHRGGEDIGQLIHRVRKILEKKRYLIAVDDLWRSEQWGAISCCFPDNRTGSTIITTTRNDALPTNHHSGFRKFIYKIGLLTDNEAKELFLKKAFSSQNDCPQHLQDAFTKVLRRCAGLPLAVVNIAGKFAHKPSRDEWEKHGSNLLCSSHPDGSDGLKQILDLSYNDLQPQLRSCFLYLSIFPENSEIETERLVRRWIAEGFIAGSKEETAISYLNELIGRNLVQPLDLNHDGIPRHCRVHPVIYDFIVCMSMEDNFATLTEAQHVPNNGRTVRRLSLNLKNKSKEDQPAYQNESTDLSHARSVTVFGQASATLHLTDLKVVRVLDLDGCNGPVCLNGLCKLVLLKYLSLKGTDVSELPEAIGDLRCLETLDVRSTKVKELPPSIVRLEKIMHLLAGRAKLPGGMAKMKSMRSLSCASTTMSSANIVEEFSKHDNLRELELYYYATETPGNKKQIMFPVDGLQTVKQLCIRCTSPSVTFVPRVLAKVQALELRFEKGRADESSGVSGLEHLWSLKHLVLEFEKQDAGAMATVDAVRKAAKWLLIDHQYITIKVNGKNY